VIGIDRCLPAAPQELKKKYLAGYISHAVVFDSTGPQWATRPGEAEVLDLASSRQIPALSLVFG
jgi:hypothetical protein